MARMQTYSVHEAPEPPVDRIERGAALVFVKEGFSWMALAFGPLWLAARKMWLALIGYLVVAAVAQGIVALAGGGAAIASWLFTAINLLIALEGDTIERWSLDRKGYAMLGTVSGNSLAECERRFLDGWLTEQPFVRAGALSRSIGAASTPFKGERALGSGSWRSAFGLGGKRAE